MILGAILAGGRSSRFGSDKALARVAGVTLLERMVGTLQPHVDALVICGRPAAGHIWLADRPEPGLGPLGGVCAALHHAADRGYARVLTVPCDTPMLAPEVLETLAAAVVPTVLAPCPVVALWPVELGAALDGYLADNARSVRGWADRSGAHWLASDTPVNVNRPSDLALIRG